VRVHPLILAFFPRGGEWIRAAGERKRENKPRGRGVGVTSPFGGRNKQDL